MKAGACKILLAEIAQEFSRLILEARKDCREVFVSHVASDGLANHVPEVRGQGQVTAFIELGLIEAGPAAVDFAAFHRTAQDEHHVGVAVVGAAVAVFARGAAELRHGDDYRVFAEIAKIGPEGGERLREVGEHVGKLAFDRAFIDVVVPSADVGKGDLHAEIGFDQLRELA